MLLGPTYTNPVCSNVSGVSEKKMNGDGGKSVLCTGLGAITRERYKQKNTMLRDPYVIKRSDFWTKLKYLHAIEVVDIG